jgi:hypothetical protein
MIIILKNLFIFHALCGILNKASACPGGPMDRIKDSGSFGAGSIPARDAMQKLLLVFTIRRNKHALLFFL